MAIGITQGQSVDPRGIDQGLEEFVKGRGGMSAFIPGKIEKGLATVGGGQMRDALTSAQDTYYNSLIDKDFNNPFSLSESEQAFIDNFNNRGDDRTIKYDTPAYSDDAIGYDFSPPPPQARGIQLSDGYEAGPGNFNEVYPDTNIGMGAEYGTSGEDAPTANPLQVVTDSANDTNPSLTQLATDGLYTSPNVWNQSANTPITGTADQMANRQAGIDATARWEAQGRPSGFSRIGNYLSDLLGLNDQVSASSGPVALSMPLPQQVDTPTGVDIGAAGIPNPSPQAIQQIGDGLGEAGTEMDMPAPPPPISGSVRMPTQGMTQEDRPVPPGLMQTLLNRLSGKDPNKPFTGNPPPPSSGSVRMPTQNLGN